MAKVGEGESKSTYPVTTYLLNMTEALKFPTQGHDMYFYSYL